MKRLFTLLMLIVAVLGMALVSNAALYTIGTAAYDGYLYKLVYEGQLGGSGLIWLDYTSARTSWENQVNWAMGLSFTATQVNLNSAYVSDIDWSSGWRLPATDVGQANISGGLGYAGPDNTGYHNYRYGYNMVNSEMGHLFYGSLGNKGYYAKDGTSPQADWGLRNKSGFDHLSNYDYWSGTEYSESAAWYFIFGEGYQSSGHKASGNCYAMAVHPGSVSAVPIPGAVWLLGFGLTSLIGLKRNFLNL